MVEIRYIQPVQSGAERRSPEKSVQSLRTAHFFPIRTGQADKSSVEDSLPISTSFFKLAKWTEYYA